MPLIQLTVVTIGHRTILFDKNVKMRFETLPYLMTAAAA